MSIWQKLSQICVILLILIAAVVAVLLILGIPAWFVIICYWVVLTGKNACDLMVLRNGTSG